MTVIMMSTTTNESACTTVGLLEDRYVLGDLIGAGSMGQVYSAYDTVLGIEVAVKMLYPELVSSRRHVERFASEARIAARMLSRNVVKVLGLAVTAEGAPCIVYERLEGETLGERIVREGGISLTETLDIVKQTSAALARAHSNGVIHRDVKPDNVFLTQDSEGRTLVKLLDFGIAEVEGEDGTYAHCQLAGTPEYMAPEIILGTHDADRGVDLYALGVMVFECLTGQCPFPGPVEEVVAALRAGTRAPFTEHRPDLHGAIDAWMDRALHADPFWRFSTVKELRDAFEAAMPKAATATTKNAAPITLRAAA
jgi:serine/threonine-protein kinase